jgi:FtsP/CotA-like multicopper oxidase with cupredoxin domain
MQVISADGIDVEPVWTKEILMGMAETYDVLFEVPANQNYELRATCQDVTGHASGWIGNGERV